MCSLLYYYTVIYCILNLFLTNNNKYLYNKMGIGDWGLGIGDWAQSPIPNPQSPIPIIIKYIIINIVNLDYYYNLVSKLHVLIN